MVQEPDAIEHSGKLSGAIRQPEAACPAMPDEGFVITNAVLVHRVLTRGAGGGPWPAGVSAAGEDLVRPRQAGADRDRAERRGAASQDWGAVQEPLQQTLPTAGQKVGALFIINSIKNFKFIFIAGGQNLIYLTAMYFALTWLSPHHHI